MDTLILKVHLLCMRICIYIGCYYNCVGGKATIVLCIPEAVCAVVHLYGFGETLHPVKVELCVLMEARVCPY